MENAAVTPVASASELQAACERIAAAPRIGLDTEFHNERSYAARLMVVQIALEDDVLIIDPLAIADLRPLVRALQHTLVVGHALSSDLRIFAERFASVPPGVFDCQIAAAFLGYGMAISLSDLVHELCHVRLKKSQTVSDWSVRPLSQSQIEYLIDDVTHLLPMQDSLTERLRAAGRYEWVLEECRALRDTARHGTGERRLYTRIPGSNRMNRRELGILLEVVKLRDRIARERDVPLKYVLPDDVVAAIALLRPKNVADLEQLRRLDARARKTLGAALVEAVARGERLAEDQLPAKVGRPLGSARETLVALMNLVVSEIARANDLPTSLLVPRPSLERVARDVPASFDALVAALDLSPWRAHLVGEPLWHLLCGESSLRIKGYADGNPRIIIQP